jgi:hypothetical protein
MRREGQRERAVSSLSEDCSVQSHPVFLGRNRNSKSKSPPCFIFPSLTASEKHFFVARETGKIRPWCPAQGWVWTSPGLSHQPLSTGDNATASVSGSSPVLFTQTGFPGQDLWELPGPVLQRFTGKSRTPLCFLALISGLGFCFLKEFN